MRECIYVDERQLYSQYSCPSFRDIQPSLPPHPSSAWNNLLAWKQWRLGGRLLVYGTRPSFASQITKIDLRTLRTCSRNKGQIKDLLPPTHLTTSPQPSQVSQTWIIGATIYLITKAGNLKCFLSLSFNSHPIHQRGYQMDFQSLSPARPLFPISITTTLSHVRHL